jgi:PAS domain S-box-containing protein
MPTTNVYKFYIHATIVMTIIMTALLLVDIIFDVQLATIIVLFCLGVHSFMAHRIIRKHTFLQTSATNKEIELADHKNALLAAAIESSPAGVVIADATQAGCPIIFVNKAFTTITGYSAEEALGRNCSFLHGIHTNKDTIEAIRVALNANKPIEVSILNYRKDQTQFWNELQINPIFDEKGKIKNFIALQNDATEMHNTQQALTIAKEQAERATTVKSNFMAMMSHEIRTPINGILGTLSLLNDTPMSEEARQLSTVAYHSADALLTIVNDMLDFSKIEAGKLTLETTSFSFPELIDSCMTLMQPSADAKKIDLKLHYDSGLPSSVAGDPTRIKQVLLNLISNAIKFTDKGSVTIKATNLLASSSGSSHECIARIEVVDTGIGMTPDGLTQIFTEFNQLDPSAARRFGGTGLGLAICRRLITMMHGEIEAESRYGEGSKFWFVLPLKVVSTTNIIKKPTPNLVPQINQDGHILIVEDNATNQLVLTKMLERAGYRSSLAENGAIAIDMVKLHYYNMIYMDVSMPVMDGLTATRHIREMGGDFATLPIVAMTAQTMPGDRERCMNAGMNDYLSKPIDRDSLIKTTHYWMQTAHDRDQSKHSLLLNQHAATQPYNTDSTLNWQILQQLADDVGVDAAHRLLCVFETDMEQRANTFRHALATEDWDTLLREAHTLKSSGASCGLTSLAQNMQAVEIALINKDSTTAQQQAADFDHIIAAAQNAIKDAQIYYQKDSAS